MALDLIPIKKTNIYKGCRYVYIHIKRYLKVQVSEYSLKKNKKFYRIFPRLVCLLPISIYEFVQGGGGEITYLDHDTKLEYVSIPKSREGSGTNHETIEIFPDYVAKIENVMIIPDSNLIVKNGYIMSDYIFYNYDGALLALHFNQMAYDKEKVILNLEKKKENLDNAIFLGNGGSENLWHLAFDILARMRFFDKCGDLNTWPILIDGNIRKHSWAMEFLNMVNKNKHPIIYIEERKNYYIKNIAVCSLSYIYIPDKAMDRFIVTKKSVEYMRKQIISELKLKLMAKDQMEEKSFYIYRGDGRLANEEALASRLKEMKIEIVRPESFDFLDEVNLFFHATIIIGSIGAGMTNTIFCNPNCKILCISPKERTGLAAAYAQIAEVTGADFYMIAAPLCEDRGIGTPGMRFIADIDEVLKKVKGEQ